MEAFRSELLIGHESSYNYKIQHEQQKNINFHFHHLPKLSIGFNIILDIKQKMLTPNFSVKVVYTTKLIIQNSEIW